MEYLPGSCRHNVMVGCITIIPPSVLTDVMEKWERRSNGSAGTGRLLRKHLENQEKTSKV